MARLVQAALANGLDEVLSGHPEEGQSSGEAQMGSIEGPAGAFLARISVTGFRGIGPSAQLDVPPGPGLTLVVGRNGTAKSSFAEGLEFALTGNNWRWDGKSKEWEAGWRNLHHEGPPSIEARFVVDGAKGEVVVARRWPDPKSDLDASTLETEVEGRRTAGLDVLGWDAPIETHRPFLSHSQLSEIVEKGPSARFDAMSKGLGLERLSGAREGLRKQRLADDSIVKEASAVLAVIIPKLEGLDDERAQLCVEALKGESWRLDDAGSVLAGGFDEDGTQLLNLLRALATLRAPAPEEVNQLLEQIEGAQERLDRVKGTDAEQSERLLKTLEAALAAHDHGGDQACPVCGQGRLDSAWAEEARKQQETLREKARSVREANAARTDALASTRRICAPPPPELERAGEVGVDASDATLAWQSWQDLLEGEPDLSAIATRLVERSSRLLTHVEDLRGSASEELERREDIWRPLSQELRAWLPDGHGEQRALARRYGIGEAERWLGGVEADVRDERFRPLAGRAQRYWELMRQRSSVSLDELGLTGRATSRRLDLSVTVDGAGGSALGVMSQGELNVLALSLFLARATMPESPFRFLSIDDPIQAMDPTKVDGLAGVLNEVAQERQVVVFTHDARLPEAVRRLRFPALVVEIDRREDSRVFCRTIDEPVTQHLNDARAVLHTPNLEESTYRRVVPGFCRLALEAACVDVVQRRRADGDVAFAKTEQDIRDAKTLNDKLGLALFGQPGRASDAVGRLNQEYGRWAGDVVMDCNRASHGESVRMPVSDLVESTERLATQLRVL